MIKKEKVDYIFFNIKVEDNFFEAIAIRNSIIIDFGSIPYLFSNYRATEEFNAQGKFLILESNEVISKQQKILTFYISEQEKLSKPFILWEFRNNRVIPKDLSYLDEHWDDH